MTQSPKPQKIIFFILFSHQANKQRQLKGCTRITNKTLPKPQNVNEARVTCKEYPEKAPGNCSAIISIAARKATT